MSTRESGGLVQPGVRERITELMVERVGENDALVRRYLNDAAFQNVAFEVLSREIFAAVRGWEGMAGRG